MMHNNMKTKKRREMKKKKIYLANHLILQSVKIILKFQENQQYEKQRQKKWQPNKQLQQN